MDLTPFSGLFIPASILACAAIAKVAGDLSVQAEGKQVSRVGRIEAAVSRIAGGIAADLLTAKAAGAPAAALDELKSAAIDAGTAYLSSAMPGTLSAAGATALSVTTMLSGEVGRQQILAAAPGLLTVAASGLLASLPASQVSPPAVAEPAADAAL